MLLEKIEVLDTVNLSECIYQTELAITLPAHKSIQTAVHNYLFNWVALTEVGEVITLTNFNVKM